MTYSSALEPAIFERVKQAVGQAVIKGLAARKIAQFDHFENRARVIEHHDVNPALNDMKGLCLLGVLVRADVAVHGNGDQHFVQCVAAVTVRTDTCAPAPARRSPLLEKQYLLGAKSHDGVVDHEHLVVDFSERYGHGGLTDSRT